MSEDEQDFLDLDSASAAQESKPKVVIIGAGLAGIAAGVCLARQGVAPIVIETKKRLGGRAGSFVDPKTNQQVDNCQHVVMRSCTALLDLYEKLGVSDDIQWYKKFFFLDGVGNLDTLQSSFLPAPFHLAISLWRFKSLTIKEKLAISKGMYAILRCGKDGRKAVDNIDFRQWLDDHNQPGSVIEKFWAPVIISACNERIKSVPASYAMQVFQDGFLCSKNVQEMGISKLPLEQLYEPARQIIESAGGQVLTGTSASGFVFKEGKIVALRTNNRMLYADKFISTLPFDRLEKLVTDEMVDIDERLRFLNQFAVSPIIGIHLYFDISDGQDVMQLPHVAFTQSPLQWVFNKGTTEDGNQHLHGVISAAFYWVDKTAEEIANMAADEVRRLIPQAKDARLSYHKVIKEKRATVALGLGIDEVRPGATGAIENLFLAGDWTNTGWPATMEGAVRSGNTAARECCG